MSDTIAIELRARFEKKLMPGDCVYQKDGEWHLARGEDMDEIIRENRLDRFYCATVVEGKFLEQIVKWEDGS